MVARIQTAGDGNPFRSMADNAVQHKYPSEYRGFKINHDRQYEQLLRVTKPDGTDFGLYSDERNYTAAIDVYLSQENAMTVQHITKSEFENAARQANS